MPRGVNRNQIHGCVRPSHMAIDEHLQIRRFSDVRDELMTAEQLAALLKIRRSTIEDYARRGLLLRSSLGATVASSGPM